MGSAELGAIAGLSKGAGDFVGALAAGAKALDYFIGGGFAKAMESGFMK